VLEVRDNGTGIDPDVQQRIFEPFYSTKPKISGRGLGLAAVSGIAKTHGAELRVESTVGKGTTFTMLLPAALSPAVAAELSADKHSRTTRTMTAESNHAQCTILLIEDTDNVRKMCACLLHDLGYRTLAENGGDAGVDTLKKHAHAVSAVLLDWSMPPPGGRETFQRLRELCPDLPIVIMSGYAESVANDLLSGGRTTFLEKPFTRDELGAALRAVIRVPTGNG
jgi:CheY-like chemotaxis protein